MDTLEIISAIFVLCGIASFLVIYFHIRSGFRQPMKIMEAVWPLTGLWASIIGLWGYFSIGKSKPGQPLMKEMSPGMPGNMNMPDRMNMSGNMNMSGDMNTKTEHMNMPGMPMGTPRPHWQQVALSTLHCGAGCSLADLIGEWFTYFIPVQIGGSLIAGQWVLDYILALGIGILFQYAAIQPMEHLPTGKAIVKAFKIDFFSLTAWQIGMYGWMAITLFVLFNHTPLPKTGWNFWFMMQIAMCFGFLTAYPVNWLLIKSGIKHAM